MQLLPNNQNKFVARMQKDRINSTDSVHKNKLDKIQRLKSIQIMKKV